MLPGCDSSFKICQRIHKITTERGCQQATSFETVAIVEIGSYSLRRRSRYAFQPLRLCRLEHHPLCSSSCQHDQSVTQLSGNFPNQSRIKPLCRERQVQDAVAESSRCPSKCSQTSTSAPPIKSSRPTAKNSSPVSPLVALAFARLRLILRRKRADLLLLL